MTTMTISDPLRGVRRAGVRRVTGLKVASTPARAWQEDTCNGGFPGANFPIIKRRFVVDPDIGAVVALSRFSVNELPDSHLFRLEKGKIRFVHTLTVCTIPDCGFKVPARK